MKLNPNFFKCQIDDDTLAVVPVADAKFKGIVQGNSTVGDIIDCLLEETSEEKVVAFLCKKYNGERAIIAADVADIVSRLKKIGAIDE